MNIIIKAALCAHAAKLYHLKTGGYGPVLPVCVSVCVSVLLQCLLYRCIFTESKLVFGNYITFSQISIHGFKLSFRVFTHHEGCIASVH